MKFTSSIAAISLVFGGRIISTVEGQVGPVELPPQTQLNNAKTQWQKEEITNYEFQYTNRNHYAASENVVWPWTITVTDGVASAKDGNGNHINWATPPPPTVDELFQNIQQNITACPDSACQQFSINYDSTYAYPKSIYVVPSASSDGYTYDVTITNFKTTSQPTTQPEQPNTTEQQLSDAKSLWKSQGMNYYSFVYQEIGGDSPFLWTVTVSNGDASAVDSGNNPVTDTASVYTIDELFTNIFNALSHEDPHVEVTYNKEEGYPEEIYIVQYDETSSNSDPYWAFVHSVEPLLM